MGLDLEADIMAVVKPDDPRVVAEDAHEPVAVQLAVARRSSA